MFSIDDYAYELPEALIAQHPAPVRDRCRLLSLERASGGRSHRDFEDLVRLLAPSDLLVINDTRVVPGRLPALKKTGGKAEILILDYAGGCRRREETGEFICECLVRSAKPTRPGTTLLLPEGMEAEVLDRKDEIHVLRFTPGCDFTQNLERIGKIPLPPYIRRGEEDPGDAEAYQTVYACRKGAIAAPTAGLHFSEEILERIRERGVEIAAITLHVGYGTFLPVRVTDIREHRMHSEWYTISEETAAAVNRTRARGGRVAAVGTTCVRSLEYASDPDGRVSSGTGSCDLFIYPGYRFKTVDAMLTNFHLPRSTLLMLVSAFAGREAILAAYREAVVRNYRFFSYGDAMWIG
jgi:S-adenosylmethionine:tRNA ribosyltransferase-isomerase